MRADLRDAPLIDDDDLMRAIKGQFLRIAVVPLASLPNKEER